MKNFRKKSEALRTEVLETITQFFKDHPDTVITDEVSNTALESDPRDTFVSVSASGVVFEDDNAQESEVDFEVLTLGDLIFIAEATQDVE